MHDRDIVAAIVAGDPAGLADAYDRYAPVLHAYCRSLLPEPADAADAVQDTFVIAAAKLSGLRDPDRLRPWLYAVARNECYRRLRSRARFTALDEAGLEEALEVTDIAEARGPDQEMLRELVGSAVAGLNTGDREIIELNLKHDLGGADLAGALGVPVNQAHALASRARAQLERSLGALLVARTGRQSCPELDAILAGWDGALTVLLRKRVSRHVDSCETCGERKRRELSPAMFFSVLPLIALPRGLRQQVLRLVSDNSPEAVRYRDLVVRRAGHFGPAGFPKQVSPAGLRRARGVQSRTVLFAAAAALVIVAGAGGTSAYLLGHRQHARDRAAPVVTVTITATPSGTGVPVAAIPAPATSTPAPVTVAPAPASSAPHGSSPSPSPSPGTLSVSPTVLRLTQSVLGGPYGGTLTVAAQGGPVSYSISVPSAEQPYLSLTPLTGTLTAGETAMITVTVSPVPGGPPPAYANQVTIEPGGIAVLIEYPPSG